MLFFGHDFKNAALVDEALTTPSYRMDYPKAHDNQRLEFLGDAVLGFLAARRLYEEFTTLAEGPLTVKRTHMVSAAALCVVAARFGLAAQLKRNRHATPLPPNSKILADAIEAIIGAAYEDGGLAAAEEVFAALELNANAAEAAWQGNPKGELQVRVQAMKPPRHPEYTLVSRTGKSHEPVFTMRVTVEGVGEAEASARSRQEAEAKAAALLLAKIYKEN